MTVWNLGSINVDHVYTLPTLPQAGETLAATSLTKGLGGKGANMSVAGARAGGDIRHIGAVGSDGGWARKRLAMNQVDITNVTTLNKKTGHAVVAVDELAENLIILHAGANRLVPWHVIAAALEGAKPGNWFVTQNETNFQQEAARLARAQGLKVAYAAAPFDARAVQDVLPMTDLLVLNEVEATALQSATGRSLSNQGILDVVVTLGAAGCVWFRDRTERRFAAPSVEARDTTGAGDTFTGYLVALLGKGWSMADAIEFSVSAAALKVTRWGATDAIPSLEEVQAFHAKVATGCATSGATIGPV